MQPVFVDLETTGLDPRRDRITEIGIICGDEEWSTLVNPGKKRISKAKLASIGVESLAGSPAFQDIADEVLARLQRGGTLVAHNAHFDLRFLQAEFERAGIEFNPDMGCSVALSRALYPTSQGHDLDDLITRHVLPIEQRHRALPDARAVRRFWDAATAEHGAERLELEFKRLITGPMLPEHLDPRLVAKLPDKPGIYLLRTRDGETLAIGKAANIRAKVMAYLRRDRISSRALSISHRIADIDWRETSGPVGAHFHLRTLQNIGDKARTGERLYSWKLVPCQQPCIVLREINTQPLEPDLYGLYPTERKAHNVLQALASQLGITEAWLHVPEDCGAACMDIDALAKLTAAMSPLKLPSWDFAGPVGIREKNELHIVSDWRYLGSARTESEAHTILENGLPEMDGKLLPFIAKLLRRLPQKKLFRFEQDLFARRPAASLY